jgi:hypothetical protein
LHTRRGVVLGRRAENNGYDPIANPAGALPLSNGVAIAVEAVDQAIMEA